MMIIVIVSSILVQAATSLAADRCREDQVNPETKLQSTKLQLTHFKCFRSVCLLYLVLLCLILWEMSRMMRGARPGDQISFTWSRIGFAASPAIGRSVVHSERSKWVTNNQRISQDLVSLFRNIWRLCKRYITAQEATSSFWTLSRWLSGRRYLYKSLFLTLKIVFRNFTYEGKAPDAFLIAGINSVEPNDKPEVVFPFPFEVR